MVVIESNMLLNRHVGFRINEQQWVEVEKVKEKLDHKEERSHVLEEQNNSTTTLTSPVTSFSSVDLKQSPTNKKKKRK